MRKRGKYIFSAISLLILSHFSLQCIAQLNSHGYPFIKNYTSKELQAPGFNLDIAMNSKGVMYFANQSAGVLEYDGMHWKLIEISNHSQPKSLAVDSNDVVFVGATGELGFIAPDEKGNSRYSSLTHLIDTSKVHFTNIRKTYATPQGVFFCSFSHIFHFQFPNQMQVIELPNEAFNSYYIDNKIINSYYKKGLLEVRDGIMVTLPGVENLIDQEVQLLLPYRQNEWLMYANKGLYSYNTTKQKTIGLNYSPILRNTNEILSNSLVYNGCSLPHVGIAFATINKGIFIADSLINLNSCFDGQTGLQSSTVANAFINKNQGILWAALDNGISRIELGSPFRIFSKESNLNGNVLSALRYNGTLYAGTLYGLSYLTFDHNQMPFFMEIEDLKGKFVYSMVSVPVGDNKSKLVVLAGDDFYEVNSEKAMPLNAKAEGYVTYISSKHRGTFYAGCSKGIRKVTWQNGKWHVHPIANSGLNVYSIFEDKDGDIWASTAIDGLVRVTDNDSVTVYTTRNGLPSNSDLRVYYHKPEDKILVATRKGVYQFNRNLNVFEPSNIFNLIGNHEQMVIEGFYEGYNGDVWVIREGRLLKVSRNEKSFSIDSVTFRRLPDMSIESFYTEPNGITWICTSEGLISYDNNFEKKSAEPFQALIRSVTISSNDSLIFGGSHFAKRIMGNDTLIFPVSKQFIGSKPVLKYRDNSLVFTISSPYFQEESAIQYSYMLEGYNTSWSKWSGIERAVYTNLREGNYTFRVKAQNIFGQESMEDTYSFIVLAPWYRTIFAFVGYVFLAVCIIILSVKFYTRKLEADKKRLEGIVAERTAEVVMQKVEIEHKNKEITDSIVYAKRIQEALLPVKNQISVPNVELFVYFKPKDIVSGDFYFIKQIPERSILIATAADCTGHGVPGAFMSMLGISFLNELIAKQEIPHSDEILNQLRLQVIASLNPKGLHYETKDGMDIALIVYNYETNILEYSGANNPLYLIRNGELNEIKADKMPIGLHERCGELFRCEVLKPEPGDTIYMFSDGFPDQFGGEKGKKYMSKNFKEFLLGIHQKPMTVQEQLIAEESVRWRGSIEQIDDQCVLGIRFLS